MRPAEFTWGPLSVKQATILSWWRPESPWAGYEGIIADGAIRSGKTISMGFSYVIWAMETFDGCNFAMCGKTIGSLRRNVINTLKKQLRAEKYAVDDKKADQCLVIRKGRKENFFYLFGGKDESSQDNIQGVTLAGTFFDEVALMPESFVNQATARCSVTGSKYWFNCNPAGPLHWFYQKWILRCRSQRLVYLHFTMADNLTLAPAIVRRYMARYTGVFYDRYIRGLWAAADGLIYDMFDRTRHVIRADRIELTGQCYVSSDYGIQNATTFLAWAREKDTNRWICYREYYYSGRDEGRQKTVSSLVDGLVAMLDGDIPDKIIVDPSAAALIVELRKRGYMVRKADNDVLDGIADVGTMLNGDRIAFSSECKHTLDEFGVYCWDAKAADHGEDRPMKENDHCMDAVRYFVHTMKIVKKDRPQTGLNQFL